MKNKERTDKRGRILRGVEDRRKLIEAFQRSGQRQAEFCRERGLNPTTLNGWIRKHGGGRPAFAEVTVPIRPAAGIEVELPNGARVHLPAGGDAEQTALLIRRVAGC